MTRTGAWARLALGSEPHDNLPPDRAPKEADPTQLAEAYRNLVFYCERYKTKLTPQGCLTYRRKNPLACKGCTTPRPRATPPNSKWTKETIFDAFMDCIAERGSGVTSLEFKDEYLHGNSSCIARTWGSWNNLRRAAGLEITKSGRKGTGRAVRVCLKWTGQTEIYHALAKEADKIGETVHDRIMTILRRHVMG